MYEITTRDFDIIKNQLLDQLSNSGIPYIVVVDGNYLNKGELLLLHRHEFDLNLTYAQDTLKNICSVWKRPVHMATIYNEEHKLITWNGTAVMSDLDESKYIEWNKRF